MDTGTPTSTGGDNSTPPGNGNTGNNGNGNNGNSNNGNDGNGSNGGNGGGSQLDPRVEVKLDRTAVSTELGKKELVTVTFTSVDGFTGEVDVAPSLVDAAGAALAGGITVTGDAQVTLTAGGTKSSMYTVSVPTNATGAALSGTVKFDVTSAAGAKELSATLAVAPVLTFDYAAGLGGNTGAHPLKSLAISVKKGAVIRLHNADTAVHITHGQVFPHENQNSASAGIAGNTYEVTTANIAVGQTGVLGCHSHGNATYGKVTIE